MQGTQESPLIRQWKRAKAECKAGTIVFFRLGDFYETFEEDAKEAAALLGLALTRREGHSMTGFPYHAAEAYIFRLLKAGKRCAIADELEPASTARGIVRREVTAIYNPENP